MKAKALNELKFKDFLPVVYEDIEPYLIGALGELRKHLIALPDGASEESIIALFEASVNRMNEISESDQVDSSIDTEEREGLCDAYRRISKIVGTDPDAGFVHEWREW